MSECWPGYEGDPKDSGFKFSDLRPVLGCVSDPEIIVSLVKTRVDYPDIFSLVWGYEMCSRDGKCFPSALKEIVSSIKECIKKKEEALDAQEQKIQGIILDLLWMEYKKQVNDIVDGILERK